MVEQMKIVHENKIANETKWLSQLSIIFHHAVDSTFLLRTDMLLTGAENLFIFITLSANLTQVKNLKKI